PLIGPMMSWTHPTKWTDMPRTINTSELSRLGESQDTEFKRSLSLQREGLETLCGMVNSETGKGSVLFGVEPDGTPIGVEPGDLDSAQQKLVQHASGAFDPPIQLTIDRIECEGRQLIEISAIRHATTALHEYKGRAFIREGTTTRRLTVAERDALTRRRNRNMHQGPWQCDRCGSIVGMLVSMVVGPDGVRKTYKCQCGGEYWPAG
ncbi:helix-turn-helix domain-containing protein, partial [Gemmatimonadota bacterium]